MNYKQKVIERLLDNKIDIYDLELVVDIRTEDNIEGTYEVNKKWEGTIKYRDREFKFEFRKFRSVDNGSDTAEITSQKPEDMKQDEWDETVDLLQEKVEDNHRENEREWDDEL